ncbi:MAG: 16S rRNA (guanine(527)-N(7))-methyltransferase RsmG [candidate division Zixibacteria bacterium RBG_16_50_21]|nr:MAG: 16S rRNA (guanine(527)-N(7))-methyltransferase RsmG [candidate division Zixibacteria bacterium RBG_16_50_21]
MDWNQKLHLVSKGDATPARAARQIIDSLFLLPCFDLPSGSKILDVGTGAGYPVIPLKTIRSDLNLVLTESLRKKASYLQDLIEDLRLQETTLFVGRARELPKQYNQRFDYATAKASGELAAVWTEVYAFLKKGGALLTYKGPRVTSELKSAQRVLKKCPGEITRIQEIKIEELNLGGYLVCVRKK